MKKIKFIRWGALSPVNQKGRFVPDSKMTDDVSYHRPPCRRGCYAFPINHVEMFLVSWKLYEKDKEDHYKYDENGNCIRKKEFLHPRKFDYSGKLWTHFHIVDPNIQYYRHRNEWHETDTDSFEYLLNKYKWNECKLVSSDQWFYKTNSFNWFSRGWKCGDSDWYEVFIENPS